MEIESNNIGNRIKKLRKYLGLNQTEFGIVIGIKQSTVAGYETGVRDPIDTIILSICREFNVSEKWLRTGNGEMFLPSEDETAEFVSMFLEEKNPFFDLILETMRAYKKLERAGKATLYKISTDIIEHIKKEDD